MKYLKTFWNRRYLLQELVKKGIKLKYRRSYLGIIWSMLEPILTTIVLTVVFGTLFNKGGEDFPMYIIIGRLLYSMFSSSTKAAAKSIRGNAAMIKKVYVPKYMYPLSSVLYNYVIFLISLVVLIPLALYCRIPAAPRMFLMVIPLIVLFVISYGVALILATITVFFRDMEYLWGVILMLIMYTSAIFYYPDNILKSSHPWILTMNPIYCIIQNFREIMMGGTIQWMQLGYAFIFGVIALVIGNIMFYIKQDKFILQI